MSNIDEAKHRRQAPPMEQENIKRIKDERVHFSFLSNGKTLNELTYTS